MPSLTAYCNFSISTLQSDIKSREEMIKKMCSTNKDLEEKLSQTLETKDSLRWVYTYMYHH